MSSDWAIELHNERMETDEQYAADYEDSMMRDAALEAEFFEREKWAQTLEYMPDFHDSVIEAEGIETIWLCPDCEGSGETWREYGSPVDLEPTQIIEDCELCSGKGVL